MTDLWSRFWYAKKKISIVKSVGGKGDSSWNPFWKELKTIADKMPTCIQKDPAIPTLDQTFKIMSQVVYLETFLYKSHKIKAMRLRCFLSRRCLTLSSWVRLIPEPSQPSVWCRISHLSTATLPEGTPCTVHLQYFVAFHSLLRRSQEHSLSSLWQQRPLQTLPALSCGGHTLPWEPVLQCEVVPKYWLTSLKDSDQDSDNSEGSTGKDDLVP